ncbi:hypothetical protein WS66_30680 [Burkholderia sp. LA-2-3-30-S1-D2]|nr:hypothetical protein WS66_30680 [Burkholderia sp. LA-2-3-30-S1-D2]KVE18940.1 hypothetical protein WS66_29240 [Burkholderia sp. LA-2-3-30-S1-D2]
MALRSNDETLSDDAAARCDATANEERDGRGDEDAWCLRNRYWVELLSNRSIESGAFFDKDLMNMYLYATKA